MAGCWGTLPGFTVNVTFSGQLPVFVIVRVTLAGSPTVTFPNSIIEGETSSAARLPLWILMWPGVFNDTIDAPATAPTSRRLIAMADIQSFLIDASSTP